MQGYFITFEGGEGAGKSTQIPLVKKYFEERGFDVLTLREPGGTPCAEEIRRILKTRRDDDDLCDEAELLLMYASRAQLTRQVILPALQSGKIVLCDRYDLSTVAYQGGGRGIPLAALQKIRDVAIGDFYPDLTLLFDLSVEQGMSRARSRGESDRFEDSALDFFRRVRNTYLECAAQDPAHIRVIDASRDIAAVTQEITSILDGMDLRHD